MKSLYIYLTLITVFISGIYVNFYGYNFFLGYLIIIFLYLAVFLRSFRIYLDRSIVKLIIGIIAMSMPSLFLIYGLEEKYLFEMAFKFFLLILLLLSFYLLFVYLKYDPVVLFFKYYRVAYIFSCIALCENFIFVFTKIDIVNIVFSGVHNKNYGLFLGASGLSGEPAFFACSLLPAAIYSLVKCLRRGRVDHKSTVVILAIFLSTSSLGILGIILGLFYYFVVSAKKQIFKVIFTLIIVSPFVFFITSTEYFQLRFNDTISLFSKSSLDDAVNLNVSTYSIAVNSAISLRSVIDNSGFGYGFGMYSNAFDDYISEYSIPSYRKNLPGRGSATSFILRINAELGVAAVLFFVIFALKNTLWEVDSDIGMINASLFCTIMIVFLRMGEYYINGVVLFIMLFYFSKKYLKSKISDR